jgi:hypothetical protein
MFDDQLQILAPRHRPARRQPLNGSRGAKFKLTQHQQGEVLEMLEAGKSNLIVLLRCGCEAASVGGRMFPIRPLSAMMTIESVEPHHWSEASKGNIK